MKKQGAILSDTAVSGLFGQVRDEFSRKGLLRRAVRFTADDKIYSVRCDEDCFTVYCINKRPHLPPGLPGWMVCRISSDDCFSLDESGDFGRSSLCGQHAQGRLETARAWAELVLAGLDKSGIFES